MSVVKFSLTYIQSILQITSVSTSSPLSVASTLFSASTSRLLLHLLSLSCPHRLQFPLSQSPCPPSLVNYVAKQHQMLFQLMHRVWGGGISRYL